MRKRIKTDKVDANIVVELFRLFFNFYEIVEEEKLNYQIIKKKKSVIVIADEITNDVAKKQFHKFIGLIQNDKSKKSNEFKKTKDRKEDHILDELKKMNSNYDEIKSKTEHIIKEFGNLNFLTSNISIEQSKSVSRIVEDLNSIEDKLINIDWDNSLFQNSLNQMITNLDDFKISSTEKAKLETELNRSDLSVKHKLKFVIPLVFMKYEAELELSNKQKTPQSWTEWKRLFLKD